MLEHHYKCELVRDYTRHMQTRLLQHPFHVKCARELDDNSPSKSDHKDPLTIAMLVKDGRYRDVYIPVGVYQELREFVCKREGLVR